MSIAICFVAFTIQDTGKQIVYALPGCDPKNTGNMTCYVEGLSKFTRPQAVCYDTKTKKLVYSGPAYPSQET